MKKVADIIIQSLNALSLSSLLFLMSVGLTIIWGLMRIVNFAHGAFFMAGAYLSYAVVQYSGNYLLACIVGPIVVGGVGVLVEVLGLRILYKRFHIYQFLFTFGVAYVLEELIKMTWGVQTKSLEVPKILAGSTLILGSPYPIYRIFLIIMGIFLALGFWLFLERTKVGLTIIAAAENDTMVAALGFNINKLRTFIFFIGGCVAALGGVLAAPVLSVFPDMGTSIIIDACVVVVVGGLGSFGGSIIGSLIIGFAQSYGNVFFPDLSMAVIYATMAILLIFFPRGLLGRF